MHRSSPGLLLLTCAVLGGNLFGQGLAVTTGDWTQPIGRVEQPLEASGGTAPYAWNPVSCDIPGVALRTDVPSFYPPGATAGLIGIAATTGTYACTVQVTDAASATATRTLSVRIHGLVITSNWELPDGAIGAPYSHYLTAAGGAGTLTFELTGGSLPPGLTLAADGRIAGTPAAPAGEYNFSFTVGDGVDSTGSGGRIYISPLRITTPVELPPGTQGVPYSQAIAASGGTPPYTYSLGCCLPGEFSFDGATGVLSGTPNGPGYWQLMVEVRDRDGNPARRNFAFGVAGAPLTLPSIDTQTLEDATLGERRGYSIFVSGGRPPFTWTVTGLPPGMAVLDRSAIPPNWASNALTLMGSPTTPGTYTVRVTAADSTTPIAQTATREYALRVVPVAIDCCVPGGTYGAAYDYKYRVLGGPPPFAVTLVSGALPSGLAMDASGRITGTPEETGWLSFQVQASGAAGDLIRGSGIGVQTSPPSSIWIHDGGTFDILVNAPWSHRFSASGAAAFTWTQLSGMLPPGMTFSGDTLSGTPTANGVYTFTLQSADSGNAANFDVRTFRIQVTPVQITSNWELPWTNSGSSYSATLTATGGDITWQLQPGSVLPPGLTLSSGGVLSGTPAFSGQYRFGVVAADSASGRSAMGWISVAVYPPGGSPPLSITTGDFSVGIGPLEWPLDATGGSGTYTWSHVSGTLPPGVAVRSDVPAEWLPRSTGGLIGVATTPGTYSFTVQVTDGLGNTATKTLNVTVSGIVITSDWTLPDGSAGAAYDHWITGQGGAGPLTFTLHPGQSLPPGLTLSANGHITGIPTEPGSYHFNFSITDGLTTTGSNANILIHGLSINTPVQLPVATLDTPYSTNLSVSGGTPPYTFTPHCCLPNGLSLSAAGVLSGTPAETGYWPFWVSVQDSAGKTAQRNFAVGVARTPPAPVSINTPIIEDFTVGSHQGAVIFVSGGTPPFTWSVTSGELPPGVALVAESEKPSGWQPNGVTLMGTPTTPGTYTFTLTARDSSVPQQSTSRDYTVRISRLGTRLWDLNGNLETPYSRRVPVLGGTPPYTVTKVSGDLPDGLTMDATGLISGTPHESGKFHPVFELRDAASNVLVRQNEIRIFTPSPEFVFVDNSDLGEAYLNAFWSRNLDAQGGARPYTWALEPGAAPPPGMTLASNGILSGTPATAGNYSFKVRITDAAGNYCIRIFRLQVTPVSQTGNGTLPWTNAGTSISATLTASGGTGALTWSAEPGTLPPGLSLSSAGVLSGTLLYPGDFGFNATVTDSLGYKSTRWYNVPVYPAGQYPPVVIAMGPDMGVFGLGYLDYYLFHEGGNGSSYLWEVVDGSLPPGIHLRTDFLPGIPPTTAKASLTGNATTAGLYNFTLRVTSGSSSATQAFTMRITNLTQKDPYLPDAYVGVPYNFALSATGNSEAVTFALEPHPQNPPGLDVAADGTVSGIPTTPNNNNYLHFTMTEGGVTIHRWVRMRVSAIRVTTDPVLPNAEQNAVYAPVQLAATGGTGEYNWSTEGGLPNGLTLSQTGVISGRADSSPGYYTFRITVSDGAGNLYTRRYAICVTGVPLSLPRLNTPDNFDDWALGNARWFQIAGSGGTGPYSFSATGLPPGVSLRTPADSDMDRNPMAAELWGAPTATGDYVVNVTMTDSSTPPVSVTRPYTIHVSRLNYQGYLPIPTRGSAYAGKLRVLGGTPPYQAMQIFDGKLPAGLSLDGTTGDISGTPQENGWSRPQGFRFSDSAGNVLRFRWDLFVGNPLGHTVEITNNYLLGDASAGQFYSRGLNATGAPAFVWSVNPGSTLPEGLTLSASGTLSGTPAAPGVYFFLIRAAENGNQAGNYGIRQFQLNVSPMTLTTNPNLPWSNAGTALNIPLAVTGATGAVTWSLAYGSTLPPGVSIAGGALTGTPASAGYYSFDLVAQDSAGNTLRRTFNINLYPAGAAPPLHLPLADANVWIGTFTYPLNASGGTPPYTYSWAEGATPIPGVRVQNGPPFPNGWSSATTGALLGVVTNSGVYETAIRVADSAGRVSERPFRLTVTPLVIDTTGNLPPAFVGVFYSFRFNVTGGTPDYLFSVQSGTTLPDGLTLNPATGVLSGIPTTPGSWNINIVVSDKAGNTLGHGPRLDIWPFRIDNPGVLPLGTAGTPYSTTLTATGGSPPYTWGMGGGGNLPSGLTLNNSTGVISGTPTGSTRNNFSIRVTDSTGRTFMQQFTLQVLSQGKQPPLGISTGATLGDTTVGGGISMHLNSSGGTPPYTWTVEPGSNLPPGVSLVASAADYWSGGAPRFAALYGRPYQVGNYNFTLRVTDALGAFATRTFTLKVSPLANSYSNLPIGGTTLIYNQAYSQQLLALGGSGTYTWTGPPAAAMPGLTLSSGGLLSGTPNMTGGTNIPVTITNGADTLNASINLYIASPSGATLNINNSADLGTYSTGAQFINLNASGSPLPAPNYTFAVIGGSLPPGMMLLEGSQSPSGQAMLGMVATTPGTYTFTLQVTDAAGNAGYKTFTLRIAGAILYTGTNDLPNGTIGRPYSASLVAFGSGLTWSVAAGSSLPAGLGISSGGVISGTPSEAGNYSFTVAVTDANALTITRIYNLRISGLSITDADLPQAVRWTPYSHTLTAPDATNFYIVGGGLPNGLYLSPAGVISGTPDYAGNYSVMIEVSNGSVNFSKRFMLVVKEPNPQVLSLALSATWLPDTTLGQSFATNITPGGGVPPYTVALDAGSTLPPGLQLIGGSAPPAGMYPGQWRIAGAPSAAGNYTFTLVFRDSEAHQMKRTFTLKVTALGFSPGLPNGRLNSSYSFQLTGMGATPPYEFTLVSGSFPAGLTMSSGGLISGTPVNAGTFSSIVIRVRSGSLTFQRAMSMQVNTNLPKTLDITGTAMQVADGSVGVRRSIYLYHPDAVAWSVSGGSLPPGMQLVDARMVPDWPGYIPGEATVIGAPGAPGIYTFAIRAEDAAGNFGVKTFTWRVTPINLLGWTPLPEGRVGTPYSYQLQTAGGTPRYYFSFAPNSVPPPGLTVSDSGLLGGTPQVSGRVSIPLQITDSAGASLTFNLPITILEAGQNSPLVMNIPEPFFEVDGAVGQPYLFQMNRLISGGVPPFTWTVSGTLPAGMSLVQGPHPAGAYLTGTPTSTDDDGNFSLTVTDSVGQTVSTPPGGSLNISPVRVAPDVLPSAVAGSPYSVAITASGGAAPVSVELSPWSYMPGGLSYSGGAIVGTPASPGVFAIIFQVRDAATPPGRYYYRYYRLAVDSPTSPAPWLSLDPGVVRVVYEKGPPAPLTPVNVTSTGGAMPFTAAVNGIEGASLSVTAGSTPRATNLVLSDAIPLGDYVGTITANPPAGSVSLPAAVPVFLTVREAPPCTYSVTPSAASIGDAGGSGTLTITTGSWCPWTATASQPWVVFTSPTSGTGNGTVSYTVAANPYPAARDATVTVQGQTHSITQFGTTCSYSINPAVVNTGPGAGSGIVAITASASGCPWTAASASAPNLTLTGATTGSGNGSVAFEFTANPGAFERPLTATIAGKPFTLNQAGQGCAVSLSPSSSTVSATGGPASTFVTTLAGCTYSATPGTSWITVSSAPPSGEGTVELSIQPNSTTTPRYGSVTIGGEVFQVSQQGVACSFSVSGANPIQPAAGGSGSFSIAANGVNCDWNSASSAPWLRITGGATGSGNGTVSFAVDLNSELASRAATLTIAGQELTITQAGQTCAYDLRSPSGSVAYAGGNGSAGLLTAPVCTWGAVSSDPSWLSVGTASGTGGADILFTAQPNPAATPRSATITITGVLGATVVYTVSQPGAPCSVNLPATATSAPASGTAGSFTFTTAATGCEPPVVQSFAGWVAVTSTFEGTEGTVNFTVGANPAGLRRTGLIQVADKTFTITQTAADCSYTLNTIGASFGQPGGTGAFTASQNVTGCTPLVAANPEITLSPLVISGNQFTQNYLVAPFSSITPWVRLLYIDFGGQIFKVKQRSW